MGRATRWFRSLFGGRKERKDACTDDPREKRRWSFKSGRDSLDTSRMIPQAMQFDMHRLRSLYIEAEKEQSKHAIAVAAATAAAADAAVAAAEAAVAVVRLARQDFGLTFDGLDERITAAVKIQTLFRGYLAKKALRALKALVKLQALVRGFIIRKQAAATLHGMEALIRAQATVLAQKSKSHILLKSPRETFDEENRTEQTPSFHSSSIDWSPKFVEIDTRRPSLPGRHFKPECRCSVTANNTPRLLNLGLLNSVPPSPAPNYPNYMSNTRAFEAKARGQSAPKQRPEQSKRVPLGEVDLLEQSRASLSCMQRPRSHQRDENFSFRSEGAGKMPDRSLEFYLQRKW